jgi:glyoxylase I family protein
MIEVESLHHVGISVTDLDRAKHFYGTVLGLEEITRPPFDFPGAWYQVGDRQLHLIVHPGTRTLRGTSEIDSRDGHYAIRVRSYRQSVEHLKALGVSLRERPDNRTPWPQIHLTDPDGNVIELNAERLD